MKTQLPGLALAALLCLGFQPPASGSILKLDAPRLYEQSITVEGESGPGGRILVRARSGATFVPAENSWSDWQVMGETGGTIERPRGRYVQIAVELSTSNALQTPRLRRVQVAATPTRPEDWTARLRVLEEHNEQIVRTSIPFEYEPLDHPHLKRLREQYKLDKVVQGARTELELMLRLAQWTCNYWDWPKPLPLNQGTEEWSWTGHYVWTDREVPAGLLFDHRLANRSDFEWTLNQAHYVLEPAEKPGTVRVHLDTKTPSFETFLAEIDAAEKKPILSSFTWTLHPGKNHLRVTPRNVTGREGISSWIDLEYP